jgi:hypothetical protein
MEAPSLVDPLGSHRQATVAGSVPGGLCMCNSLLCSACRAPLCLRRVRASHGSNRPGDAEHVSHRARLCRGLGPKVGGRLVNDCRAPRDGRAFSARLKSRQRPRLRSPYRLTLPASLTRQPTPTPWAPRLPADRR